MFICQHDDVAYMQECTHEDCKIVGQTLKDTISEQKKNREGGTCFSVGDIVKHKASFLQSIQMYTNVPKNGIITHVSRGMLVKVRWCDSVTDESINEFNIMHASEPDYSGM